MKKKKSKMDEILDEINSAKNDLSPSEIAIETGIGASTVRGYVRRLLKKEKIAQAYHGTYCSVMPDSPTYGMAARSPLRVQNLTFVVLCPSLKSRAKILDYGEEIGDAKLSVKFGRKRGKVTVRVGCKPGLDRTGVEFAVKLAYRVIFEKTGLEVEELTCRTLEAHRDLRGVTLDSYIKCFTVQEFDAFLDRIYEKEGSTRVETKIMKDITVDEAINLLHGKSPSYQFFERLDALSRVVSIETGAIHKLIDQQRELAGSSADVNESVLKSVSTMNEGVQKMTEGIDQLNKTLSELLGMSKDRQPVDRDKFGLYG